VIKMISIRVIKMISIRVSILILQRGEKINSSAGVSKIIPGGG
jgi:hypothetical protein